MGLPNGMTLWEDLFWASFQQYIKGWTKKILVWSKNGIANKWIETSVFGIGQFHRWCFSASPWKNPRTSTSIGGKIPIWLVICKRFGAILGPKLWSEFSHWGFMEMVLTLLAWTLSNWSVWCQWLLTALLPWNRVLCCFNLYWAIVCCAVVRYLNT